MGDEIPADGRLIKSSELCIDQSLMTGESEPVRKQTRPDDDASDGPDQPGCLYRGTQVVDGAGQMVIANVGDLTMIGQIARRLSAEDAPGDLTTQPTNETSEEARPEQVDDLEGADPAPAETHRSGAPDQQSRLRCRDCHLHCLAHSRHRRGRGAAHRREGAAVRQTVSNLLAYFVYMVIIIVVAVPEGLPMSVTVSLALAMRKMTRANSLVRQLVACETIGSATIICSDKTGTLTQNRMRVERLSFDGQTFERDKGEWPGCAGMLSSVLTPVDAIALNGAVNSTANLEKADGKVSVVGNSTEGALLQWIGESGIDYLKVREQYPVLYLLHFSSERKRMTTVVEHEGDLMALVKGAPEIVLEHSTHYLSCRRAAARETRSVDALRALSPDLKDASSQAMRTLAFASRRLPADMPRWTRWPARAPRRDRERPRFSRVLSPSAIRCAPTCRRRCSNAATPE